MGGGESYIFFVDSDDFLEHSALEDIYGIIKNNDDMDIVVCSKYLGNKDLANVVSGIDFPDKYEQKSHKTIDILIDFPDIKIYMVWLFIYNANFLFKHDIKFIPKIYYEDALFSRYAFVLSKKIFIFNKPIYNYRINREGSIMNSFSIEHMKHSVNSYFFIVKHFEYLANQIDCEPRKQYLLHSSKHFIKYILKSLQFTGYLKDLDFSKDDLKKFLPYVEYRRRFCFYFPRIYGLPNRIKILFIRMLKR